jgi:DNA-binding transcriptional MerR regulator
VPRSTPADTDSPPEDELLHIREVASETGLTARAIRYYEELGLLQPAARSDGAYRLYDASDLERLKYIRRLRDDAGFSLAEIGLLLEDETLRRAAGERFRATDDPIERRTIAEEALARVERQLELLRTKATRIAEMIDEAEARERHLREHLTELAAGPGSGSSAATGQRS